MIIKIVDNFQGIADSSDTEAKIKKYKITEYTCKIGKNFKKEILKVTLSDFINKDKKDNKIFSFFESKEPKNPEKELIISVKKDGENYQAQTGNYIGKFKYNGIDIEINSRFSEVFLKRMLNFANDVYLDDVDVAGDTTKESFDISKFILYYLFIQKLEKAFLLGLPKSYTTINHHDINLKGNVDINRFIKQDIPFKGKISSKSREQIEVQEIIDILHKVITIIDKSEFSTKNISHIKTHLKQHKSKNFVSNQTIQKALNHKALNNPIFAPYKEILKLAKYIINQDNLEEKENGGFKTYGFLVDVASLFEIYLVKLLRNNFEKDDWDIIHEDELKIYEGMFYQRKILPDIVMKKDDKVVVFDAKYKKMNFNGSDQNGMGDLDRCDFFQIHTYMSYYKNQGKKVITGGLLYPIESEFDKDKTYSNNWLGNNDTKFIVDGIDLSCIEKGVNKQMSDGEKNKIRMQNLTNAENNFIKRIKNLIDNQT